MGGGTTYPDPVREVHRERCVVENRRGGREWTVRAAADMRKRAQEYAAKHCCPRRAAQAAELRSRGGAEGWAFAASSLTVSAAHTHIRASVCSSALTDERDEHVTRGSDVLRCSGSGTGAQPPPSPPPSPSALAARKHAASRTHTRPKVLNCHASAQAPRRGRRLRRRRVPALTAPHTRVALCSRSFFFFNSVATAAAPPLLCALTATQGKVGGAGVARQQRRSQYDASAS